MKTQSPLRTVRLDGRDRRWRLAVLVLLVSCALGTPVLAGKQPAGGTPQLDEFTICTDPGWQWNSEIDGLTVVWTDERNGNEDIYGYDLATGSEFPICTAGGDQSLPDLDGSVVVWLDNRNATTGPDIYGYHLDTHSEFPICTESRSQLNPAIDGDVVVWQDSRNGSVNQDIYGYNLITHSEFPICTAGQSQVGPAIHGNIVVWMDYRNEPDLNCWPDCNTDIYGYDLSTGTEFPIVTEEHLQGYPAIYGDVVVWIDKRNGNSDVYAYNLATHQEFPVCTEPHEQIGASVGDDWIVWTDKRNEPNPDTCGASCNYDLYAYELATGTERPLVTEAHWQFQQSVDGNLVIWTDKRNEPNPDTCGASCNFDIYGLTVVSGEAGFASGRTAVVGLGDEVVVEFALPMDTASVTYACEPDPGGWIGSWGRGRLLTAGDRVLSLSHAPFSPGTAYVFTVTGGETAMGQSIEPFGMQFTTLAVRIYLPVVLKDG